jgi:hypothetical protein
MEPTEEWKSAVSTRFPDLVTDLDVSNLGNIRKKGTGFVFKTKDHKEGYMCIKRKGKTIYRHTLVAETFLGSRPDGFVIDHIDNDKENNKVSNLRYITSGENSAKNKNTIVVNGVPQLPEKPPRHLKENLIRAVENFKVEMKAMTEKVDMLEKRLYEANAVILALVTQLAGSDAVQQVQSC